MKKASRHQEALALLFGLVVKPLIPHIRFGDPPCPAWAGWLESFDSTLDDK